MESSPLNTFRLPFEVLEVIVDFTDILGAQNCALTCKALLSQSRANIFSHVRLLPDGESNFHLHQLLKNSPHLEKFIQHIALLDLHLIDGRNVLLVVNILERLGHIRTISLVNRNVLGCSWRDVPIDVQDALFRCFQSEALHGVDAQIFSEAHLFIEGCPKLQHFEMYEPYATENWIRSSPAVVPVGLKSFRVSLFGVEPRISIDAVLGTIAGDPLLDFSHLEKLILDSGSTPRALELTFQSGQWISRIAPFAANSLVELVWDVGSPDIQSEQLHVTLDMLPCLTTLEVRCHSRLDSDGCCAWATRLMLSRIHSPTLLSASFTFGWNDDPRPISSLIRAVKGAQRVTLHFQTLSSSDWSGVAQFSQETLDILRERSKARQDISFTVMPPMNLREADSQLNYLRTHRPFVRGKLQQY
ncbi:hypothetical protein DL96DRAFT_1684893 [Flagelloscypha sp. PMI_526]|nr:hypothetical protein DL96DRAFT_1684893 [Flagelloscypha sp. PMI_526]